MNGREAWRPGRELLALVAVLVGVLAFGNGIWRTVSPRVWLSSVCYVNKYNSWRSDVVDPWGREVRLLQWPTPVYSVGADGRDDQGAGDDIVVYPLRHPTMVFYWGLRGVTCSVLGAVFVARLLWITPVASPIGHEVLRSALIALCPTLIVLGGALATFASEEIDVILSLAMAPVGVVGGRLTIIASVYASWFLPVFGARVRRVQPTFDTEEARTHQEGTDPG